MLHFATQNNTSAGGTLTEAEFETWLRSLLRYGSNRRTIFVSPLVASVLNAFATDKLQTIQADNDKTYGLAIKEWQSIHGTLSIVKHNLLSVGVYTGYAVGIDFQANVAYRYLNGDGPGGARDTQLLINRQENDRDGRKDEYLSECGLQFPEPKRHGVLTGVTG